MTLQTNLLQQLVNVTGLTISKVYPISGGLATFKTNKIDAELAPIVDSVIEVMEPRQRACFFDNVFGENLLELNESLSRLVKGDHSDFSTTFRQYLTEAVVAMLFEECDCAPKCDDDDDQGELENHWNNVADAGGVRRV